MAGPNHAYTPTSRTLGFGIWLRQERERRNVIQRTLAAAANMDSSHLGKVERGKRLPTLLQAIALAKFLGLDESETRTRLIAARMLLECGDDVALAHSAAGLVQEQAAPYFVNNQTNKK